MHDIIHKAKPQHESILVNFVCCVTVIMLNQRQEGEPFAEEVDRLLTALHC